ncbi:lipoyl(octanoyl) transferase LipB [Ferruginibacter sp. SUN002]|uniref:lipoyl(octanoyl) transferase LipB n=1 Tax=Ferruginibacter sp. SUN002 TaxID=2937789 RepID=UPI003D36ED76
MDKQIVHYKDLGIVEYKQAWDYQESLLQENIAVKVANRQQLIDDGQPTMVHGTWTKHYLLFCEHPPVYTLGKSGSEDNILINDDEMEQQGIQYFKTNRGGDITFHGLQQVVGYPILDLEKFYTDIGRYLRELEEVIILTLKDYGIVGERSKGETGVWIEPGVLGKERKICAMGVRCSRWITMHGFALNVNTDLSYFNNIIPCGIQNKQVTSLQKELGREVDYAEVKQRLKINFEKVFNVIVQDN